jgi:hypothetical protein
MTTLTLRYIKGDFLVTGPDIEPRKFVRVAPSGQELEDDSSSRLSHNGDREAYAGQRPYRALMGVFPLTTRPSGSRQT